jgi:hypothetical protein
LLAVSKPRVFAIAGGIVKVVSQVVTKAGIAALKVDIEALRRDITVRLRSMIVLAVGVITGWCRRCVAAVALCSKSRLMRLTRPRTER